MGNGQEISKIKMFGVQYLQMIPCDWSLKAICFCLGEFYRRIEWPVLIVILFVWFVQIASSLKQLLKSAKPRRSMTADAVALGLLDERRILHRILDMPNEPEVRCFV